MMPRPLDDIDRAILKFEETARAHIRADVAYRHWLMMIGGYDCLDAVREFRRTIDAWADRKEPRGER